MGFATFLYNQLLITPSLPSNKPFTAQTVIITGSNTGLGLETARHAAHLGAKIVILAVRDTALGEVAKKNIESSLSGEAETEIEVWSLDLANNDSVLQFAERANQLQRIDTLVLNAALATKIFKIATDGPTPGFEQSITVNSINHFLLAFLLLPKMRQTANEFPDRPSAPHITVLTSQVHAWPEFPQWEDPRGILAGLSDERSAKMEERYPVTKLLNVFLTREFAAQLQAAGAGKDQNEIIVNMIDPGFCHSRLSRENVGVEALVFNLFKTLFARTEEAGARTVVAAAAAGRESDGKYMVNGVVDEEALSQWVKGSDGRLVQKKLWDELRNILEGVKPGCMDF
ncbi:hypothetical protein BDV18DRAFT_134949 [Aspergillus unguis]